MNIFITGTDTGIGKTVVSTILALKLGYQYWKPIQSGLDEPTDSDWVAERIGGSFIQKEIYKLRGAFAPYISAELENQEIHLQSILDKNPIENTIIEGCGGLFVPINKTHFMIDLIDNLGCPTILVARSGLGTINHTLLSLESLRARRIQLIGIVLVGDLNLKNKEIIELFGKTPVIGQIPILPKFDRNALIEVGCFINLEEYK